MHFAQIVEKIYQDIWDTAIDNGIKNKFPNENGNPKWDDLSQIVISFTSNNEDDQDGSTDIDVNSDSDEDMIVDQEFIDVSSEYQNSDQGENTDTEMISDSIEDPEFFEDEYGNIDFFEDIEMEQIWDQLMVNIDTVVNNNIDPYEENY